jgi:hypothetical protein
MYNHTFNSSFSRIGRWINVLNVCNMQGITHKQPPFLFLCNNKNDLHYNIIYK